MTDFHKDFQLNSTSFSSVDELLSFSKSVSESIHLFLKEWFSEEKFVIVQTSGSTGTPKLIKLKKECMVHSALATGQYLDLPKRTTALLCLPTEYIAGKMMLVRALTLGWHLEVVLSGSAPLKEINKEYDFSAMVPLQVENSLQKLHLIKKLIVGGGVVSSNLQEQLQKIKTQVFATYGMTETITHIAVKKLNQHTVKPVFYETLPNVTIYKDDRDCLVIKAPKIANEVVFTNDIVRLVSDKQFEWLGRFDTVINSGGIKLHPEQIEKKLSSIIYSRYFVTGVPDIVLGEKLVLIIEGKAFSNSIKKSLKEKIKNLESLSKYEIPKEIYFIDTFIETETKKIQRNKTLDLIKKSSSRG